jgi:hypothetical protein
MPAVPVVPAVPEVTEPPVPDAPAVPMPVPPVPAAPDTPPTPPPPSGVTSLIDPHAAAHTSGSNQATRVSSASRFVFTNPTVEDRQPFIDRPCADLNAQFAFGTLGGFRTSREGLRQAKPGFAHAHDSLG